MLHQPFFQVSLPIMITILGTVWALISTNNRRLDDISARLARIEDRLLALETRFSVLERKVDALELKTWQWPSRSGNARAVSYWSTFSTQRR